MTSRASNKIKQRRERLKENQTPSVVSKPNNWWFWILAIASIAVIIFLAYLAYTSDLTNELIIPIIVAVIVLVSLVIWFFPKFYVRSLPDEFGKNFDREKERLKLEDDTRKTFAQIVGGILFLGGLIFTFNTFRLQQDTYRLQQEGQFTDRFTKAVAQLGDDKLEVRLGGLYALERIAKDSPKDHWTVMEVLSAYIRGNSKKEEVTKNNKSANNKVDEEEMTPLISADTQAALTIIGRRKVEQDSKPGIINLTGANLTGATLTGANLRGAVLTRAILSSVVSKRIDLTEANLRKADLTGAVLSGGYLTRANLREADLAGADLTGANLTGANLVGVRLSFPTNLAGADLKGADLRFANLGKARKKQADLRGADLRFIDLTFEDLGDVIIDENTKLPNELEIRKAELLEVSKRNLEKREEFLEEINNYLNNLDLN